MSLRNVILSFPNIAVWPLAAVLLLAVGSPSLQTQDHAPQDRTYYFPHLAVGASWQTTITYINDSPREVTCRTDFISDDGSPLTLSFPELGAVAGRTDVLPPGGIVHEETNVDFSAPLAPGWARATCSGPVKASLLFRRFNGEGTPAAEAAVKAATLPATRFITFAEQREGRTGTGVAYANPSSATTLVTLTARDAAGLTLASEDLTLPPGGHGAQDMASLFGLSSFSGSLEVTSTEPIVSLSLNFEADPVFSSLPPGETDASGQGSTTYYFPHLAVGASWQTTITYINDSPREVTCRTDFISDYGSPLRVSFPELGAVVDRTDVLPPGGSVHEETNVELSAPLAPGWARAACSGPVKASLLFRRHGSEGVATGEAGVNASRVPATRFITFAEQGEGKTGTGVAYANPSAASALVTLTARNAAGQVLASVDRSLMPGGHEAHGVATLFGLTSFVGSLDVTSTEPIVSLSLNFEADPVFSSLPPGETVDISGQMLAPANEAAFNDLFLEKRLEMDDAAVHVDFVSPGRFRKTEGANTRTGSYTYESTSVNSGAITYRYDDGDRCTEDLTFVSPTSGTTTQRCSDGSSGVSNWRVAAIPSSEKADLVVQAPSVGDSGPSAGESFTLSATVLNQGDGRSAFTTLRYYRSADATITAADTEVGTDAVGALSASGSSGESVELTAPDTSGTYYYGACVDAVTEESDTTNNCSSSVTVTVPQPVYPDLEVGTPTVSDSSPAAGAGFTLSVTVSNAGDGESEATTLRYYRSADATITTADTAVGTDPVAELAASGSSSESVEMAAPDTGGTYYYGACVDAVTEESDTTNNCSSAVTVTVPQPVHPDLAVGAPSVTDNGPETDAGFTLSVAVRNDGAGDAPATTLRYYRSTDVTITTADTAVGTDAVAELAASGSSSKSVDLTAPASPGTHYYGACVDAVTEESDTTNNCSSSVEVTVVEKKEEIQGQPDLAVGTPTVDESSPAAGAGFTLSATVSNTGDRESEATTLRYYRSTDATITTADTAVGTDAVAELSASGSSAESISLTAPEIAGTYYYGACVDTVTEESDTTNNCSSSVTVTVPQPVYPDLVVGAPTVSDDNPAAGAGFTLSATVSNTGDGESEATTLRYYRSTDATITTADTAVGTDAVAELSASGSSAESISLTAPEIAGTYYYGACVDTVTEESDTTNNCSSSVTVTVPQPVYPDLEVGTPTVSDGSPAAGAGFTLSATVSNAGDGESEATTLRYYQSTDTTITTADTAVGTDTVAELSASGTSAESISLTAPESAGTYYYGACVDSVTEESDTTNNCSSSVTVTVPQPVYPDLVATLTVNDTSPQPKASVTLSATVSNTGDGESPSTTLRYYQSTDATITTSDTEVGTDAVGTLAASETDAESMSLAAPGNSGTYYYGACVDAVADESDTTNNCSSSVQVDVEEPKPNLQVARQNVDWTNPVKGETFTLSATVYNLSREASEATTLRYYRSTDTTITTSDTEEGTDAVGALSAFQSSAESISLTAPSIVGTYYYGACVDAVANESDTTDNCSSSVKVDVVAPARRVDISPRSLSFEALGDSATVTVRVLDEDGEEDPDATFSWIGSSPPGRWCCTFETVDDGLKVTADKAGKVNLTINSDDATSATLNVTAYQKPVTVEVSPDSASLNVGGTATLSATVKDANGNAIDIGPIHWTTSNSQVATVEGEDDGGTTGDTATVTAAGAGTATVTARHSDIRGTASVTVTDNN